MNTANLGPALGVGVIAAFGVYRRMRRNIGRQPLQPARLWVRMTVWLLVCVAMLAATLARHPAGAAAAGAASAAGAVLGVVLGLVALRYTEFAFTPDGDFYTPHLYTGLAVTALLVARLAYRLAQIYAMGGAPGAAAGMDPAADAAHPLQPAFGSALTLAIVFMTAGYYICYYSGVLRARGRRPAAAAPVVQSQQP